MDKSAERANVAEGIVRYYLCSQALAAAPSFKAEVLRQLFYSLQFLTLFLTDSQESQGLPWDFTSFWWLWDGLSLLTRLQRTTRILGLSALVFFAVISALVAVRLLCLLYLIVNSTFLSESQFELRITKDIYSASTRSVFRVDHLLSSVMSFYCPLTLLSYLTSVAVKQDSGLDGAVYQAVGSCGLAASVLLISWDRTYLSSLDWTANQIESVSSPWYSAVFSWLDIAAAILSTAIPFFVHSVLNVGLLSVLSVMRLCTVWLYLPYHHPLANWLEAARGLMVLWGVSLITVGLSFDPDGRMPALGLLLISPLLLYFNWLLLLHLCSIYTHPRRITAVRQLEFVIRSELAGRFQLRRPQHREKTRRDTSVHQRNARVERVMEQLEKYLKTNRVALIWLLNFARLQEDVQRIKLLRAQLSRTSGSMLDAVAAKHCHYTLERWLLQLRDESDTVDFLSFQNDFEKVLACDHRATNLLRDLLEELGRRRRSFPHIVQTSHQLAFWMRKTLATYRELLTAHPQNLDVLKLFISFLDLIGQSSTTYDDRLRKLEAVDRRKHRTQSLNEPGSLAFVLSLEEGDFGLVRWARGTEKLGYGTGELQGISHLVFIPEPIRSQHTRLLKHSQQTFARLQSIFTGTHELYMCNKNGTLVHGNWLVRLANEPPRGDLVAVASVRYSEDYDDVAFLDLETQRVTAMVAITQTTGFEAFLKAQGFTGTTIPELFGYTLTLEDCRQERRLRSAEQTDLKADVFRIFGAYEQPILKLHVALEGSVRPSFSDTDLIRPLPQNREVCFEEESSKQHIEAAVSNTYSDSRTAELSFRLSQLKRTSERYERFLLLALLVTVLLSCCTATLVVVFVKQASTDLDENVSQVGLIGLRRLHTVLIALSSRELVMAARQHNEFWNETDARGKLSTAVTEFLSMRNALENSASSYEGIYRDYVLQGLTPFWQWEGSAFRMEHISLIDLMTRLAKSAAQLQGTPLEELSLTNSDFLTLFRNCVGETLRSFNSTVDLYMKDIEHTRNAENALIQVLVYTAMVVLCVLTLGAMLPLVLARSHKRKHMWLTFLACTSTDLAALRIKASERLQETHGQDESRGEGRARGGSPHYTMSLAEKSIVICLVVYLCIVCAVLYLTYEIGSNIPAEMLIEKPHYMNWSGGRRALLMLSAFWLREIWLDASPYSYNGLLSINQLYPSPVEAWNSSASLLLSVHISLTYSDSQRHLTVFPPSHARKDSLQGICDTCAPPAQRGLTPLIYEIVHLQRGLVDCLLAQGSYSECGGSQTEALLAPALESVNAAVSRLDQDSSAALQGYQTLAEMLTVAFAVFSLLMLILVFVPLVRKVTDT